MKYKIIIPQEEPKIMHNCPKCGLDLVEREGSKPVCTRIDCGGIIISNETLREWALKEEPKQDLEKEMFELEQELDIPSSMRWHNSKTKQEIKLEDIFNDEKKQGVKDLIDAHKQETLEEAAEKYVEDFDLSFYDTVEEIPVKEIAKKDFIEGAKWQAERIYNEADRIMKFLDTEKELKLSDAKTIERIKWYFETYFEQFKKK
jgi:hypothetical protein